MRVGGLPRDLVQLRRGRDPAHGPDRRQPAIDGGLLKLGAGTLTMAGANTFTGDAVVFAGTLEVATTGRLAGEGSKYQS